MHRQWTGTILVLGRKPLSATEEVTITKQVSVVGNITPNPNPVQSSTQHAPKHNGKKDEDDDDYICIDGIYVNANLNLCDDTINDAISTKENDDRLFSTTITIEQSIKCRPKDLRVAWLDKFLLLEAYKEKHNDFIVPKGNLLLARGR